MAIRRILVTGANKGIGEAIVRKILLNHSDTFVLLGSRNKGNGDAAVSSILADIPAAVGRLEVLHIDVGSDESVKSAAVSVRQQYSQAQPLYGIVNNAGLGFNQADYKEVLNVNFLGIKRVFTYFSELLADHGRVVNVTSAAGPMFVNQIGDDNIKNTLTSKHVTLEQLDMLMKEYMDDRDSDVSSGRFGESNKEYGMSKALANGYTMYIAKTSPKLIINACTPGFIATDMTRHFWEKDGKTAEDVGCKPTECGTVAPCKLLFEVESSGRYYGSDGLRSPLDRYRGPGDPEYTSEDEL